MEFLQHNPIEPQKPKRGRPRKEVKKEIEDESTIVEVVIVKPKHDYSEYSIQKIQYNDIIPNVIENVGIQIDATGATNSTVLILDSEFKSISLSEWKKGIGGIFNKDIKAYLRNNSISSNYYVMTHTSGDNYIIRYLDETTLGQAIANNINYITIGNDHYAIVRAFEDMDNLTTRFINMIDKNGYLANTTDFNDDEETDDSYDVSSSDSEGTEKDEFESYENM